MTSHMSVSTSEEESVEELDISALSFEFRGDHVPVTVASTVTPGEAQMVMECKQFTNWVARCEQTYGNKLLKMHSVEIQSVDPFGQRGVGFVKINAHCTLVEGDMEHEQRLKGICFLKGDSVAILVALHAEDGKVYSLLVEQARVAIGQISALELPAGMLDDDDDDDPRIAAVKDLEEECGLTVQKDDLVDLTEAACQEAMEAGHLPYPGIAPSAGACDEVIRYFYVEKSVTPEQLQNLQNKIIPATEFGETINLHVVPWEKVWKISGDSKTMIAMFLLNQLRAEGKVPAAGELKTPLVETHCCTKEAPVADLTAAEPMLSMVDGTPIPQLAFSLNLVPPTKAGEEIIENAIKAGYRHFDTSQFSRNEKTLGKVLRASGIPREEFFICSKVWNEAQKCGRFAVRKSVERSLKDLNFGDYFDLFMLHWPVPRYYVETYKELEDLKKKGLIRQIGFRNFSEREFKMLVKQKIEIPPAVAQVDLSPAMCPHSKVLYFQQKKVLVAASHALNRGKSFEEPVIMELAHRHKVTAAQVMIRWSMQKGFVVVSRSQKLAHMIENRQVTHFELTHDEMQSLDDLTDEADLKRKSARDFMRKTSM
ncbi:keto reductase family 1 member C1 homolog [Seminavis robusta]|uniref:Keto reductase family 1 member C1 homolog n=1 Tax=Seminavis robusta TaxID=568900 RepID=A0A9N8E3G7_9STRA|nr:keto reductase family 1 member C1 homolog [Seminavis robusta]|eukprot:Sro621_g176710.1 keto reductase family 1 member C1 homolog (596) ;mRNA; f:13248-15329